MISIYLGYTPSYRTSLPFATPLLRLRTTPDAKSEKAAFIGSQQSRCSNAKIWGRLVGMAVGAFFVLAPLAEPFRWRLVPRATPTLGSAPYFCTSMHLTELACFDNIVGKDGREQLGSVGERIRMKAIHEEAVSRYLVDLPPTLLICLHYFNLLLFTNLITYLLQHSPLQFEV